MTGKSETRGLLKISELARASDVSVSTLKFYVKEGLIPIAKKTKRNMAYYHPDCIKSVRLIKYLQKNRYYPLAVIKRLLEQGKPDLAELELYDAIYKVEHTAAHPPLTITAAIRQSGLSREQIKQLEKAGVISSFKMNGKLMFRDFDCRIMQLVKRRQEAGFTFEQTLHAFTAYERALNEAVKADIDSVISDVLMPKCPNTEEIVHMIRVSDETLDDFVSLRRYYLNSKYGSHHIENVSKFSAGLKSFLLSVHSFISSTKHHALCTNTLKGIPLEGDGYAIKALRSYSSVIHLSEKGLAECISVCSQAHHFFVSLYASAIPKTELALLLALRLGWLTLVPEVLLSQPLTQKAKRRAVTELKQLAETGVCDSTFPNLVEQALKGV
ncbi:MAG TPA: MerR family transcriptional regulator [Clostridiales bacterium]|jgi:DNA-binding transcriptional MerR regulator|nr:MerR family transcriptional regulator [Clostridiales bacterium]